MGKSLNEIAQELKNNENKKEKKTKNEDNQKELWEYVVECEGKEIWNWI